VKAIAQLVTMATVAALETASRLCLGMSEVLHDIQRPLVASLEEVPNSLPHRDPEPDLIYVDAEDCPYCGQPLHERGHSTTPRMMARRPTRRRVGWTLAVTLCVVVWATAVVMVLAGQM